MRWIHQSSYLNATLWYLIFGWLHELSHVFAAYLLGFPTYLLSLVDWVELLLFRRFRLDLILDEEGNYVNNRNLVHREYKCFVIRQFGWIASVFMAFTAWYICGGFMSKKKNKENNNNDKFLRWCQIAAIVTAIDAISSDFLLINPLFNSINNTNSLNNVTFFCGNFGVILLHSSWWLGDDGCKSAFDVLKKMIEVTMMRGAQSGGIVTFSDATKHEKLRKGAVVGVNDQNSRRLIQMKSVRSRVVKSKRQDL